MRSALFATCVAASLYFSVGAAAQPSKPPAAPPEGGARTDQARELFVKGVALYDQGQFEKAEAAFLAAWALKKHYQIASNLGACEMKLGRYRDAAEHLAFFLREQPPTANQEDRKRTQALFDEARGKVGAVSLTVNVPGAVVSVDGREIGEAPFSAEVYVDPGTRTFVASHGSYKDAQQVIEARAGGTQTVTLTLAVPKPPRRNVVPAVVMGGVGGAAVIAGVGVFIGSRAKVSRGTDLHNMIMAGGLGCPSDPHCTELASTATSADALQNVGVGFLIGAGVVGAAAVTYLLWPQRSGAGTPPVSLRPVPSVSSNGGGMLLQGTF
jgi:hypothetical protein